MRTAVVAGSQVTGDTSTDPGDLTGQTVSLIQRSSAQSGIRARRVRVIGYVTFQFEGQGFFLHREDLDNGISESAIRIAIPGAVSQDERAAVNQRYVLCEGTRGLMVYVGIQRVRTRSPCRQEEQKRMLRALRMGLPARIRPVGVIGPPDAVRAN